jgi:hypothetical protein
MYTVSQPSEISGTSTPVQRRDRAWLYAHNSFLIGPLPMPSIARIREAVDRLIEAHPAGRFNWRFDADRRCWIADQLSESIVVEGDWVDGRTVGESLDAMNSAHLAKGRLIFVRYPHYLGMVMCHGLGDGRVNVEALGVVAQMALTGKVLEWSPIPAAGPHLLSAAVRTFGPRPTLVRKALGDRYPMDVPISSGASLPWSPSRRTITETYERSPAEKPADGTPKSGRRGSRFATTACALLAALRDAALPVSPDVNVMMDLRGYLGGRWIDGNFVAAVPMRIDADTSPEELSAMLKKTKQTGRPLANQMLTSMRTGGRRRQVSAPTDTFDPQHLPCLTLTDLGSSPLIDQLPFLDGQPVSYGASGVPAGPHGVTIAFAHTSRATSISVSFHDNVIDAAKVEHALSVVTFDPPRVIDGRSVAR